MPVVLPDVPQMHKVIIKGLTQGAPFVNTFFAKSAAASFDQTAMDVIAAGMSAAYWQSFGPVLLTTTTHVQCQVIQLSSRTQPFGISTAAHAGAKVVAGPLPLNVACCVSHSISDRYRGGHPRMYLPAANGTDVQNGKTWVSGSLSAYQSAADAFLAAVNGLTAGATSWELYAVRYYSNHQLLATPLTRKVNKEVVHSRIDSMRRRTGKEVA